jgi:spore coat polysaccharide biosynthesis predicted glycosyltransferase SpsG
VAAPRIAIRCDGGAALGAGHVARCRPIALAFGDAGCETTVVGRLDGLAEWMVQTAGLRVREPSSRQPCGIEPAAFDGALVDLYDVAEGEVCTLAGALPIATLGEAASCPTAGVLIDYHLDRNASEDGPRLLAGPSYAPVDPAFVMARRGRGEVRCVLVTLGGSAGVREYSEQVVAAVAEAYPSARLLVAAGLPTPGHVVVERPEAPATLVEPARMADLAVTAAGMTAYELACAGVPFLALVVADNQARVGRALERAGLGIVLDVRAGIDVGALREGLTSLGDAALRLSLALAGQEVIDGRGADRSVSALALRWRLGR